MRLNLVFNLLVLVAINLLNPLPSSAEDTKDFNVGVIIPLTADLADYGISIQHGFELAVKTAPDKFSQIHFIYEDSRYDGKTAVSALEKMRATSEIDLYYIWGVSPTEALLPITESRKLPVLIETTVKESTAKAAYAIRAARTGERIAMSLAAEIVKRKIKSVSFLNTEIPFYNDILRHLEIILPKSGVRVDKVQHILPSDKDMRPYMAALRTQASDAVGVFLLPDQFISFFKASAQFKLEMQTFSADIIGSDSVIKPCADTINGTFFSEVGVTDEFRKLYNGKYGDDGHIGHAAQAFDVANLISDLFGRLEKKLTNDEVVAAIHNMPPRQGATGTFNFSDTKDGGKELRMPVALKVIKNKRIETITEDTGF